MYRPVLNLYKVKLCGKGQILVSLDAYPNRSASVWLPRSEFEMWKNSEPRSVLIQCISNTRQYNMTLHLNIVSGSGICVRYIYILLKTMDYVGTLGASIQFIAFWNFKANQTESRVLNISKL
jgi:hypothetical protein